MYFYVILIEFCAITSYTAVGYQQNDDEYEQMPPLVSLEPYWPCLRHPGGRYCTAYASFVADGHNSLINTMQKYSEPTTSRYNHTRSLLGMCLTMKCKVDEEGTSLDQRKYLEACLNRTVWDKYKLGVKIEDKVFCHEYDEKAHVGAVDISVASLLLSLVMCNIVGSLCDIILPTLWVDRISSSFAGQFILCFSISRNWKILTAPPGGSDTRMKSLQGIYGIRAISMILVVITHAIMPMVLVPENTKFLEDLYEMPLIHIILNGTIIMQTFLFLSAFLLVYTLQLNEESRQVTWKGFPMAVLKRWLRLTPSYAVVLAVTATWLRHAGSGPVWDIMMVEESVSCSRDWWQNLLYINNYVDDSLCMAQTWYLATDSQLYILGLMVYVSCRTPRSRKLVLSALFLAGIVAPALHTYYQDLDGPMLASPVAAMGMFITDRTFNEVYKRTHTNLASYVLGLAAGYCVYSCQKNKYNIDKYKKWRILYWLLVPLYFCLPISCKLFYVSPRVPLQYRVAAAALMKPAFGAFLASLIVGMAFKMENLYRGVLEWRGWVALSRVSYSAYLVHVGYIRLAYGSIDAPIQVSFLRMFESLLFSVTIVFLAAHLFWLTVEAPMAQLVRTCLYQPATRSQEKPKKQVYSIRQEKYSPSSVVVEDLVVARSDHCLLTWRLRRLHPPSPGPGSQGYQQTVGQVLEIRFIDSNYIQEHCMN